MRIFRDPVVFEWDTGNADKNLIRYGVRNEDRARDFWAKINLADYFESSDFEKVSFPNLKPTSRAISLRIPDHILTRLKECANEINVPYQSLMKEYIAEGIVRDRSRSTYKV